MVRRVVPGLPILLVLGAELRKVREREKAATEEPAKPPGGLERQMRHGVPEVRRDGCC